MSRLALSRYILLQILIHINLKISMLHVSIQQDGPSASLATRVFPGLISGRNFFKLRQSTAFYSGFRTIFRVQAVLSGTYFFFASKSRKKSAGIGDEKKYFKNKIFKNKVAENFLLD